MSKSIDEGVLLAVRGGVVKSSVAIGVLRALEEANIQVKEVSGTSLGSIVAALVANGYDSKEILKLFLEYNKILTRAARVLCGRGSIVIEESVNKEIGNKTFKDLEKNCYINASYNKERDPKLFLFSSDTTPDEKVGRACRASSSLQYIYGYYKAEVDGNRYRFFDGGYTANPYIPETDMLVVYSTFQTSKEGNYSKLWQRTPFIAERQTDIVIKPFTNKIGTVGSCDDMRDAYDLGYKEAVKQLRKIR